MLGGSEKSSSDVFHQEQSTLIFEIGSHIGLGLTGSASLDDHSETGTHVFKACATTTWYQFMLLTPVFRGWPRQEGDCYKLEDSPDYKGRDYTSPGALFMSTQRAFSFCALRLSWDSFLAFQHKQSREASRNSSMRKGQTMRK
ncbi:hypothetical protein U0070_012050 [Myodes glareolus]|uniref:Uncharacterized protein n=1 Tax=Myodes glareolus TaxID=447135 RepID=A0AAW0I091_MYOGA